MSQENVEVVRSALEAFARRDVDELLDYVHSDAEWRPALSPGGLEGTTYVGHDGLRQWLEELAEVWPKFEIVDPRLQAVGERVLMLAHVHIQAASSGVEMDIPLAQVWEIENGKMRRLSGFTSHAEALEAVGLSE